MSKRDKIYIYAGSPIAGSMARMMLALFQENFAHHGLKAELLYEDRLLQSGWIDDAHTLIWGGGEGTLFRKALSPDGVFRKDIIQRAHQSGVHYAGFCGGGFMAWDNIRFKGMPGYEKAAEGFGIYKQDSPGAVEGLTESGYSGKSDSAAIIPMFHHRTGQFFHSLYCCGPYFPKEQIPEGGIALASTKHPATGEEIILSLQIPAKDGCGSISLYGNHPEFSGDFITLRTREVPSIPKHDERLRQEARQYAYGLRIGFNLLLHDLKTAMGLEFNPRRILTPPSFRP